MIINFTPQKNSTSRYFQYAPVLDPVWISAFVKASTSSAASLFPIWFEFFEG